MADQAGEEVQAARGREQVRDNGVTRREKKRFHAAGRGAIEVLVRRGSRAPATEAAEEDEHPAEKVKYVDGSLKRPVEQTVR